MSKEKKSSQAKALAEMEELKSLLKRVQADFDNYRKRSQKEKEDLGSYMNMDLILRIVPVLDNFKLALRHLPKELESNEWVHGIWHIEKQLEVALAEDGLKEIDVAGQKFDPSRHEAVELVVSNAPEEEIVEVLSAGYELNGKIIRPAKVKVSKGNK
jgi:molecular chaperone GrpE